MFDQLPQWVKVFVMSMVPWLESRYVIPFAIVRFGWEWWQAFPLAILGNMVPVPFILLFFHSVERFLRRYKMFANLLDKLFTITRKRADSKIKQYEYLGLLVFVAVPLPFTGAWTGSLIAYLFNLRFSKSIVTILVGVIVASAITTIVTLTGTYLWLWFS
ncbi:MAG TPA: ligand-binding protein SH3 [Thermoplasmatales archaeon]|nr:ligand-binding protein SH3 [Thermoplasmatales archaeon]